MVAGVDGCRGGWLVARAQRCPRQWLPELFVCDRFMDVLHETSGCAIVMVDIPIGLPDDAAPRSCDMEAQRMLGKRGRNSVFPAPPRSALTATTAVEFQALYRQARGTGAPLPLWGIVAKLREVDVAMSPGIQHRVKEVHPEVAWRRLAGSRLPSKKTDAGIAARTRLLSAFIGNVDELVRHPPRHARRDDVLDALVGLVVAADAATGRGRRTCAEEPPCDARGLRMETWY